MKQNVPVKPADIIIILIALGITGFTAFKVYIKPQNAIQVIIQGQRQQKWVFPLNAEETVGVRGPLGVTIVRIHDNQAWVESSPCSNQICVAAGHVDARGGYVMCAPNTVLLKIEGNDESADALN